MGGFAGGDEAGFWDVDELLDLEAKHTNTQVKKINTKKSVIAVNDSVYSIKAHEKITMLCNLITRVVRIENIYDTISFIPNNCEHFTIEGYNDIPLESNNIYKAYKALVKYTSDSDIIDFFHTHKVVLKRENLLLSNSYVSSSHVAAFIHLTKEMCNLILSEKELVNIGRNIDPEIPFFIYNYSSANISNDGETIEAFDEEAINIELLREITPLDITSLSINYKEEKFKKLDSKSILKNISEPLSFKLLK